MSKHQEEPGIWVYRHEVRADREGPGKSYTESELGTDERR